MTDIVLYIKEGILPEGNVEQAKLRKKVAKFCIYDGRLYKRGFVTPMLKCLGPEEAQAVLTKRHKGICGNHPGARSLAVVVLLAGYYWPTLEEEAKKLVKRCEQCQRFSPASLRPAKEIMLVAAPHPFAQWGIDLVGPIKKSLHNKKFIVVAIDYFTKWAEAEALASITTRAMKNFIHTHIICRFGVPLTIVTDNGTQFQYEDFRSWCSSQGIKNHFATVAHPQSNGQVEVTNRTLLRALKKKADEERKKWPELLPEIMFRYNTTKKVSTGHSPFALVYGEEAILPIEAKETSFRRLYSDEVNSIMYLKASRDLIDERRETAELHNTLYKRRVARYYNKKVGIRNLEPGDLVRRKIYAMGLHLGKLGPN